MYEALILHLRECAKYDPDENTFQEAADAIESLLEINERQREEIAVLSNQSNTAAEQMDWERAVSNVKEVLQVCMEVGWPASFAIAELNSYIKRYDSGVRTRELYDSMMEVH